MTERSVDKKTEALKLAQEAIDDRASLTRWKKARDAIREALAQSRSDEEQPAPATPLREQQEPHCYMDEYGNVHGGYEDWMEHEGGWFPVYTSPQPESEAVKAAWMAGYTEGEREAIEKTQQQQEPVACVNGCQGFFKHPPPASKPLTDEQRNWVVATCPTPRHIIDTVEKMHGIKENT